MSTKQGMKAAMVAVAAVFALSAGAHAADPKEELKKTEGYEKPREHVGEKKPHPGGEAASKKHEQMLKEEMSKTGGYEKPREHVGGKKPHPGGEAASKKHEQEVKREMGRSEGGK